MTNNPCPYVLRVKLGPHHYFRLSCELSARHDDMHQAVVPDAYTQPALSDGWAETNGATRVRWAHPL